MHELQNRCIQFVDRLLSTRPEWLREVLVGMPALLSTIFGRSSSDEIERQRLQLLGRLVRRVECLEELRKVEEKIKSAIQSIQNKARFSRRRSTTATGTVTETEKRSTASAESMLLQEIQSVLFK